MERVTTMCIISEFEDTVFVQSHIDYYYSK